MQRRKRYLRQHHKVAYHTLLLSGMLLDSHPAEIDAQAEEMLDRLTSQMTKTEGIMEQLKASDQMEWVGHMNNIKIRAKEIVYDRLITK